NTAVHLKLIQHQTRKSNANKIQKKFENLHASGAKKKRQKLLKFTHKRVVDHVLMKKAFQLIKFDVHITHHTV
ncbi:MAG: hypothetical protein VW447_08015, partial [Limnobacter sp.]